MSGRRSRDPSPARQGCPPQQQSMDMSPKSRSPSPTRMAPQAQSSPGRMSPMSREPSPMNMSPKSREASPMNYEGARNFQPFGSELDPSPIIAHHGKAAFSSNEGDMDPFMSYRGQFMQSSPKSFHIGSNSASSGSPSSVGAERGSTTQSSDSLLNRVMFDFHDQLDRKRVYSDSDSDETGRLPAKQVKTTPINVNKTAAQQKSIEGTAQVVDKMKSNIRFNQSSSEQPGAELVPSSVISTNLPNLQELQAIFPPIERKMKNEFIALAALPSDETADTSRVFENASKNYSADGDCFDHSRVQLERVSNDSSSDYINANYVDGFEFRSEYICTQAPLPSTVYDFWRMIWQENSRVIIQLSNLADRSPDTIANYLPIAGQLPLSLNGIIVSHGHTAHSQDGYTVNTIYLTNPSQSEVIRTIHHFTYHAINQSDVPSSVYDFLQFIISVRYHQTLVLNNQSSASKVPPMTVMCSNGAALTGMFVCIDVCMTMVDAIKLLNIEEIVKRLRSQRGHLVGSFEQYRFIYLALEEYCKTRGYIDGDS